MTKQAEMLDIALFDYSAYIKLLWFVLEYHHAEVIESNFFIQEDQKCLSRENNLSRGLVKLK